MSNTSNLQESVTLPLTPTEQNPDTTDNLLESEVITVTSPTTQVQAIEEVSDSTDGSYEIEPREEKKKPVHITFTLKNPSPTVVPIMRGKYYQDSQSAIWTGKWGMGTGNRPNGVTSDFMYSIKRPNGVLPSSDPLSGTYAGYFWIKLNPPRKISENRMQLIFTPKDNKYAVTGSGSNRLGPYDLQGTFNPDTLEMTCVKLYKAEPVKPKRVDTEKAEPRAVTRVLSSGGFNAEIPSGIPSALHGIYLIFMKLMSHKWSSPFLKPVDYNALNIPDYLEIVKKPMDFGTLNNYVLEGRIQTENEMVLLIRLVFENAILYNKPVDDVTIMARAISDVFEREYLQLQQATTVDSDPTAMFTRRRSFKRTSVDSINVGSNQKQYALRRSGSVEPLQKKTIVDLPMDVEPYQYCAIEEIITLLQGVMNQSKGC